MSDTPTNHSKKHNGRSHDMAFKTAAIKLVSEQGYGAKEAALSLGVPQSTLQYWIKVYGQRPQQQVETIETLRLRVRELESENGKLLMEREILKKAAALFASQSP